MDPISRDQSLYIDFIRSIALIAVVGGNGFSIFQSTADFMAKYPFQMVGFLLFFVISGFLSGYSIVMKGRFYSFSDYMTDRFARIYTTYTPSLIFVFILDYYFLSKTRNISNIGFYDFLSNLFMLHHIPFDRMVSILPTAAIFGSARQNWTLPIGWWLCVMFGIIVYVGVAASRERVLMLILLPGSFLGAAFFTFYDWTGVCWWLALVAGAFFPRRSLQDRRSAGPALVAAIFFGVLVLLRIHLLAVGPQLNFSDLQLQVLLVAFFGSLLFALQRERGHVRFFFKVTAPIWRTLSQASFSVFLTHLSIQAVYNDYIGVGDIQSIFGMFALNIFVGLLFMWAFDRHYRKVSAFLRGRNQT